uniref:Lipoxygenase n=1 Tax=Anthurium amnicola TaxID=1678845 RepID=A0A1D1Z418_9ARAE
MAAPASGMLRSSLVERAPLHPPPSSSSFFHGGARKGNLSFLQSTGDATRRRRARARWSIHHLARGGAGAPAPNGVVVVAPAISERTVRVAPVEVWRPEGEKPVQFKVRALVTVKRNKGEDWKEAMVSHLIANPLEAIDEIRFSRSNIGLELISTDVDPRTKRPKVSREAVLSGWSEKVKTMGDRAVFAAEFTVDSSFGTPGAVEVTNRHRRELFLESIVVDGFLCGPIHFNCHSWVQSSRDYPDKRVFFSDKPYLPSETPAGLRELRQRELEGLRGDGKGVRRLSDRVYDFDVYNDLGNPDKGHELVRPPVGGEKLPYPRRCRTGRLPTETDLSAESRVEDPLPMYVPRDDAFEEARTEMLAEGKRKALLRVFVPSLVAGFSGGDIGGFHHFDSLYKEGIRLKQGLQDHLIGKLPFLRKIQEVSEGMLRYDTPTILSKDKFAWLRDDEFARQAVAGINPVSIERLKVFPPVSKLDPEIYGPPESAIREEHILGHLEGMSVQQALEEKKLFMLDYHDIYLPFLDRINAQDGRKSYATRTIFFLTSMGTLKPVAIELRLSPGVPSTRSRRVMTPPTDATTTWLWQLAKAHVCSNDAGVHQLVNHWLRTHACMEPFILAAHRQLSAMHPVFKLLHPHMRYTLETNALARQILINGGGVIESFFTPGPVSTEMSSAAYASSWRFDMEGLPADLIRRGMAEADPTQPHGLRLTVQDYPYANDGLLIWDAITTWVSKYVEAHYPTPAHVASDVELQAWYDEAVRVGHADVSDAHWWPRLATPGDLVGVLTTLVWLASAQHAALNFGQYPLGGYIPNRPPLMRRLIPEEGDAEYRNFLADPQHFFLASLPTLLQTAMFMTVIDTLSTHSSDEEYLGDRRLQTYAWSPEVAEAFNEFAAEVRRIEGEIGRRNADPTLRNRCGAGVLPYELLVPSSGPGATGRGVPNSVSI